MEESLRQWMGNIGITLSSKIQVKSSSLGGVGVFAKESISEDDIILTVPKTSVLSGKTCGIANLLVELDPIAATTMAYLFERANLESSPWRKFIEIVELAPLPDIPRLWPPHEQETLRDTDIDIIGGLDCQNLYEIYDDCVPILVANSQLFGGCIDLDTFVEVLVKVSSRVFDVDNYHNLALVPGACFFNHSDHESVHFETDGDVCFLCGALTCNCASSDSDTDIDELGESPSENCDSDAEAFSSSQKSFESYEVEESKESEATKEENEVLEEAEVISTEEEDTEENVCIIRAIKTVPVGSELFNTYGIDPNSVLLARYGFTILGNAAEVVDLRSELEGAIKRQSGKRALRRWLDKYDEEDQLEINIDGEPSPALKKALEFFDVDLAELARRKLDGFSLRLKSAEIKHLLRAREFTDRDENLLRFVATQKQALEGVRSSDNSRLARYTYTA